MSDAARAFIESLPKKCMGAGCLFFDQDHRLLLVKPAYKSTWEIPGGIVEQDESPKAACQREVGEELGLKRSIGRLLVVDYNYATAKKSESLMFIFDGGNLTQEEIDRIVLNPSELLDYAFFNPGDFPDEMSASLQKRVLAAWEQHSQPGAVYLENQRPG